MGGGIAEESPDFWDSLGNGTAEFDFATFDCVDAGDFFPFEDGVLAMRASNTNE
jgi:hypothetical protein